MKLQAKFTLSFIGLVIVTIIVSFFLINRSVQSQFTHFIEEKNRQWRLLHPTDNGLTITLPKGKIGGNSTALNLFILDNPLDESVTPPGRETPERNYIRTVSSSLFWAGAIDVIFAIILAYFLSSFLLRRIHGLKSSMHQYMKDGVSKPVLHGGQDEVDDLANMYNLLIAKIEKEESIRKEFFVDMSHELRTPLTSIKGYLEGLIDKVFDPDKEKDIHEKTLRETDRMIYLVKEMTTLAKLETEKSELVTEETNLRALTDEVVEMLSKQIERRQLKVEVSGDAKAQVDPYKFKQVLMNLVDNATHYAPEKAIITVSIAHKTDDATQAGILWSIKNPIVGAPPTNVENFFERFYRGDKSRIYDNQKPHLGIGLNIVKKIVEQHKGTITARLEEGWIVFEIVL